jgi:hypothetical protein
MNSNIKGIIAIGVLGAIGFVLYRTILFPKSKKVKVIIYKGYSSGTETQLLAFDDKFINAWYNSAKNDYQVFIIDGIAYNTKGGKAKKTK